LSAFTKLKKWQQKKRVTHPEAQQRRRRARIQQRQPAMQAGKDQETTGRSRVLTEAQMANMFVNIHDYKNKL